MQVDDILGILEQYWNEYEGFILSIITIIVIWIVQRILVRAAKKSVRRAHLPPEAANGLVLAIRLTTLFIIFTVLSSYAGLTSEALAVSGFIGAAVGFASSQTIGNVIAGIYVVLTRPFRIGEYVSIGSVEGIVREITLNYTRIEAPDSSRVLVPNRNVLNEQLRRFRHAVSRNEHGTAEEDRSVSKTLSILRQTIGSEMEVYVYPFDVAIHTSLPQFAVMTAFDEACDEWTEKFGYPPTYYVAELPTFHVKYKFLITVEDPVKILQLQPEFLKAIMEKLDQLPK